MRKTILAIILLISIITLIGCSDSGTSSSNYSNGSVANYTITFVPNGGSNVYPITRQSGVSVSAPSNPTRSGYTFYREIR